MRAGTRALLRLPDLVAGVEMTPEMVTRLAAQTHMQAHIVASELHDIVVPLMPLERRTFAGSIARRIERGTILEEDALREIETFRDILVQQVDAGTQIYWHGDDNHVRGGYKVVHRDPEARRLAELAAELALLASMILTTLSAARAVRETGGLINS